MLRRSQRREPSHGAATLTSRVQYEVRKAWRTASEQLPLSNRVKAALVGALLLVYAVVRFWWAQEIVMTGIQTLDAVATLNFRCELDRCCYRPPREGVGALGTAAGSGQAPALDLGPRQERLRALLQEDAVRDEYSVVINTFRGRDDGVAQLVGYYSSCPHVRRVIVSWNDVGREVPKSVLEAVAATHGVAVVEKEKTTNLSNRFLPRPSLETHAVLTVDDDMQYDCGVLTSGFEVWRKDPASLVGFAPRKMELVVMPPWTMERGCMWQYFYEKAYARGVYNTVFVTKGGFMDRAFFALFHEDSDFDEVRAAIDAKITGEDITMSLLHTLYAGPGKVAAIAADCDKIEHFDEANALGGLTSSWRPHIMHLGFKTLQRLGAPAFVYDFAGPTRLWGAYDAPLGKLATMPNGVACIPG